MAVSAHHVRKAQALVHKQLSSRAAYALSLARTYACKAHARVHVHTYGYTGGTDCRCWCTMRAIGLLLTSSSVYAHASICMRVCACTCAHAHVHVSCMFRLTLSAVPSLPASTDRVDSIGTRRYSLYGSHHHAPTWSSHRQPPFLSRCFFNCFKDMPCLMRAATQSWDGDCCNVAPIVLGRNPRSCVPEPSLSITVSVSKSSLSLNTTVISLTL